MSSEVATPEFLGSRPRVLARRSVSPRRAAKDPKNAEVASFRFLVWSYWKKHGRHDLPWRQPSLRLRHGKKNFDPYRILVSEVMLQQTQVPRVIEKYKEFLKAFPTVRVLAKAPLSDVLKVWSGMGYNRRAKYLRDAAKVIVKQYGGRIPVLYRELVELPGVGAYTASAVRVFACNEPDVLIETNIRTAIIYHFHKGPSFVKDSNICETAKRAAKEQDPCTWHWALMDYGAHLKRSGVRNNARSKHYVKQSKFDGSLRQLRGAILRDLYAGKQPKLISRSREALAALTRDGLIIKERRGWRVA